VGQLVKGFLDLIFPPTCFVCGQVTQDPLCSQCVSSFSLIKEPVCEKCGKPCVLEVTACKECSSRRFYFVKARTFGLYEGNLKETIHQFKYQGGKRIAPLLARLIVDKMEPSSFRADLLTWVPLSSRKEASRGYNQAYLLTRGIAKLTGQLSSPTLRLSKETRDQSKLTLPERRRNVKEAFAAITGINLKNESVLLIDDVFTTGSTVNECSKVLLKAGAGSVVVLTVARSVLH